MASDRIDAPTETVLGNPKVRLVTGEDTLGKVRMENVKPCQIDGGLSTVEPDADSAGFAGGKMGRSKDSRIESLAG